MKSLDFEGKFPALCTPSSLSQKFKYIHTCMPILITVQYTLLCRFAWGEGTIHRETVTRDTFSGPVSQIVDILVTPAVVVRGMHYVAVASCILCIIICKDIQCNT